MRQLAGECRRQAVNLCDRAQQQTDRAHRLFLEELAFLYMELADQVERQLQSGEAAS